MSYIPPTPANLNYRTNAPVSAGWPESPKLRIFSPELDPGTYQVLLDGRNAARIALSVTFIVSRSWCVSVGSESHRIKRSKLGAS